LYKPGTPTSGLLYLALTATAAAKRMEMGRRIRLQTRRQGHHDGKSRHAACFRAEGQQRYAGADVADAEGTLSQGGLGGAYADGANLRAIVPAAANLRAIVQAAGWAVSHTPGRGDES
jgi:hypothetical protein